ncbi:MAG: hypothetical protein KDJ65_24140, partial [Anaerolineae bacterium]|nr:hypothetical protein [Anaerolineae bacterium]
VLPGKIRQSTFIRVYPHCVNLLWAVIASNTSELYQNSFGPSKVCGGTKLAAWSVKNLAKCPASFDGK